VIQQTPFIFDEWLTGFFEGDGTCFCRDRHDSQGYEFLRPVICLAQKNSQVLEYVKANLKAGHLYSAGERAGWHLKFDSKKLCLPLIACIAAHVVSEKRVAELNVMCARLKVAEATKHEATLSWFVGFWDAEGFSSTPTYHRELVSCDKDYTYLTLGLGQRTRDVLESVQRLLGGKVYECDSHYQWVPTTSTRLELSRLLLLYSKNNSKRDKLSTDLREVGLED
jgi:hypothetical protein